MNNMKIFASTCPNCGANLVIKDHENQTRCAYCGAIVFLEKVDNSSSKARLNEEIEYGLELIGADRYSEADAHFLKCCKKYHTIPIVYFWKGMTATLFNHLEEAIFYLNKFPLDIEKCCSYLSQAKVIFEKSFLEIFPVKYMCWWDVRVLLESVLTIYDEEKFNVADTYQEIGLLMLKAPRQRKNEDNYIDTSIEICNVANIYLERAYNLIADDKSNVEIQSLITKIADGFINIAGYYYTLNMIANASKLVERACNICPSSKMNHDLWVELILAAIDKRNQDDTNLYNQKIFPLNTDDGNWVRLISQAMKVGFTDTVNLYDQKVLQMNLFPLQWMKLIELAMENGFYDVAISYIRNILPPNFQKVMVYPEEYHYIDYHKVVEYYVIAERKKVPNIKVDLYNRFLSSDYAYELRPLHLEFAKYYGNNLDFNSAESYLNDAKFKEFRSKDISYPEELVGPHIIENSFDSDTIIDKSQENTGYGYIGLAEIATLNGRRDLCKKYIKQAKWLLNQYVNGLKYVINKRGCRQVNKEFVDETLRQIKILKS